MRKIYFLNFSLYKKHKNVSNKNKEVFINKYLRFFKKSKILIKFIIWESTEQIKTK